MSAQPSPSQADVPYPELNLAQVDPNAVILTGVALLEAAVASAAAVQAAAPAQPSATLQMLHVVTAAANKAETVALFKEWADGSRAPLSAAEPDEIAWFLSKRATVLIDGWLMSNKFAALAPLAPNMTGGVVVVARDRVDHVLDHRANKDAVSPAGVVELLGRLFAHGAPKYAPNPNYTGQLLMFDETYKATDPAAKGETPCAVLEFASGPHAHLRLVTAYWMRPAKTTALLKGALKK